MTQTAFAEYFKIPKRTVEHWCAETRKCPEYLLELIIYKLVNEHKIKNKIKEDKKMKPIQFEGRNYELVREAYPSGANSEAIFVAEAICLEDTPDAEGWQPAYAFEWEIIPEYADNDDMSTMCNWDHPDRIREIGEYNREVDRFF